MTEPGTPAIRNSVVVGCGPAGYMAAIYLARAALMPAQRPY